MKKILIMRIGSMGDTLVSIPALKLIKLKFPNSEMTILSNKPINGGIKAVSSHDLLLKTKFLDGFIEYGGIRSKIKAIRLIRELKPDLTYYLMPPRNIIQRVRDRIFFMLCGVDNVFGLSISKPFNSYRYDNEKKLFESEASRLKNSIGFNNTPLSVDLFSLNLNEDERIKASNLLRDKAIPSKFIVISVGTKISVNDWGQTNWLALIKLLKNDFHNYGLVTIGSLDEYIRSEELISEWYEGNTINLCGKTTPRETASIL